MSNRARSNRFMVYSIRTLTPTCHQTQTHAQWKHRPSSKMHHRLEVRQKNRQKYPLLLWVGIWDKFKSRTIPRKKKLSPSHSHIVMDKMESKLRERNKGSKGVKEVMFFYPWKLPGKSLITYLKVFGSANNKLIKIGGNLLWVVRYSPMIRMSMNLKILISGGLRPMGILKLKTKHKNNPKLWRKWSTKVQKILGIISIWAI